MEARLSQLRSAVCLRERIGSLAIDRVSLTLGLVFVFGAVFYLWTAGTSYPLVLDGSQTDPYNLLATAFLHLHLSVGSPPPGLLRLPEPYNPVENSVFQLSPKDIHDFALYNDKLFLTWGPAPVVVLLVPLHLFGLEPSTSLTAALFAIAGLGFALAALRVVLRQIRNTPLWLCALTALVLALSSGVPFILRRPAVYEEAILGGYCFAVAGIWLALLALVDRRSSLIRLVLMSLCFGLAAGSRPTLGLTALVLVPVYMSLRHTRPRRELLPVLIAPVGGCLLLLAAYNQARYGNPLEIGAKYQLAGIDSYTAPFDSISYILPGIQSYIASPPRASLVFPFLRLISQPSLYPAGEASSAAEPTGGLLLFAPIVLFLVALPWIAWRRPAWLGPLGFPLSLLTSVGIVILLFLAYQFFNTTERYEVDFTTLFLLGALAAWLALSQGLTGWPRLLVRSGGGLLALWGCFAGIAISFTGYSNLLATEHPGTWTKLEDVSSPLSIVLATLIGHPVLAQVTGGTQVQEQPVGYTGIDASVTGFTLNAGEGANLTIVSPDTREVTLTARITPTSGVETLLVRNPGHPSSAYTIPREGREMRIPVRVGSGLNRLALVASTVTGATKSGLAVPPQALAIANLSLGGV
jgi:hypothetical protein